MSRVCIVTDSAATIEPAVAERLGVTIVPLTVRIGHEDGSTARLSLRAEPTRLNSSQAQAEGLPKSELAGVYQDGTDLGHEELLLRMAHDRIYPRVIGPTAEQFRRVYTRLTRHTDQIISLHSSASLSLVHREAQIAAREFLGRCDILVIDSETLSLGLDILVQEAAQLARESVPLGEIVRRMRGMIRRIYIVLVTDTLDYLEHSRLISPAQAILGAMLGIRPFLAIEEGRIIPMEKVRNHGRAIDKLAEFANEFSDIEQMAILQSTPYPTGKTKALQERLELIAPGHEFPLLLYGPLLASHIGPDGVGLVVHEGVVKEILP